MKNKTWLLAASICILASCISVKINSTSNRIPHPHAWRSISVYAALDITGWSIFLTGFTGFED